MLLAALPTLVGHVKAGKVKLLAINQATRSMQAPDVPTVAEIGVPGFDYPGKIGLLGPAGMPRGMVQRLYAEVVKAVKHPDTVQRFAGLGVEPVGGTPEAYVSDSRTDIERYAKVVRAAGIKAD
jgi:tripartite-type tricarboxylate transporter receptor subunit TctC